MASMVACPERAGKWSDLSLRLKTRLAKIHALKQGRMQELLTERVRLI